ncbi:hypothetical protein ACCO45_007637 [Purpureocillium lilacinum]|uniref:Uncharacterized protein n=1 Tax=Purpureocillium lilacinum TaxID=33203 RepID=A0ACC4DND8_PURLI
MDVFRGGRAGLLRLTSRCRCRAASCRANKSESKSLHALALMDLLVLVSVIWASRVRSATLAPTHDAPIAPCLASVDQQHTASHTVALVNGAEERRELGQRARAQDQEPPCSRRGLIPAAQRLPVPAGNFSAGLDGWNWLPWEAPGSAGTTGRINMAGL